MTSRDQLQETLCNRLFWYIAERDDARVADHLFHRREMDVVYAMDEAALFDSFFNYLQEIKVFPHLEQLDPQKQQRKNVPFFQIVLVFLMKLLVDPFVTFDRYDDRSFMENKLFREVKQNWHFEHPAKKIKEGVYIQTYLVMGMKAPLPF